MRSFFILAFFISIPLVAYCQSIHLVKTGVVTFEPKELTITAGDTLKWYNESEGLHDVVADDESFSSGDPSLEKWTFIHVFDKPGKYPYFCSTHGAKGGIGMTGVIIVENKKKIKNKGQ